MIRRLLIAFILAVTAFALAPLTPAQAIVGCGVTKRCTWTYYYDAAHTVYAGQQWTNCMDGIFHSGDTNTPYVVETSTPC